jgi:hypothetical protein
MVATGRQHQFGCPVGYPDIYDGDAEKAMMMLEGEIDWEPEPESPQTGVDRGSTPDKS